MLQLRLPPATLTYTERGFDRVFTPQQIQQVVANQQLIAHDPAPAIRLLAGPGTGKSRTIGERVHWLISQGVPSNEIVVISFTRATARDLNERVVRHCTEAGTGPQSNVVRISTMHSLALSALRRSNLLTMFPSGPIILDDWEQRNLFDKEFAGLYSCTPGRAKEIRLAYDAYWQTLQMNHLQSVPPAEQQDFVAFYSQFTTFYSCILAGEVVRRCVDAIDNGSIQLGQLGFTSLIVDEFQDMNACDQQFVAHLAASGATAFVAGDDDQSIYSFRHADATGLQGFTTAYANSTSHTLSDCFRCAPSVLAAGLSLISYNPSPPRVQKALVSLYANAAPPVQGKMHLWRFESDTAEASQIADSCRSLIAAGVPADDILVLMNNTRAQLKHLREAFDASGVPYVTPKGSAVVDSPGGRLIYALLRIVQDAQDYAAHRDLLELTRGVGVGTCLAIENAAVGANLNFRTLFYESLPDGVFTARCQAAIASVAATCGHIETWQFLDTLASHDVSVPQILGHVFGSSGSTAEEALTAWQEIRTQFPDDATLEDLLAYLRADTDAEQVKILEALHDRLGITYAADQPATHQVRMLTMHGAKGLEGGVVFIPGLEQAIVPGPAGTKSAGLLQEQRRLLYMSITRGKAACILTLGRRRTGASAQALVQQYNFLSPPSQFMIEIGIPAEDRTDGLTVDETAAIVTDFSNLHQ